MNTAHGARSCPTLLPRARARANREFPAEWRSKRKKCSSRWCSTPARSWSWENRGGTRIVARCPSAPRSPVSSGRRESWSISAFRPAREWEPRPARRWLSKQKLPPGILAPVGHPRRRGAKDDRDEDAVAGVPARLVLHRLILRGRVRAASIGVSHWCVRGLRWAGSRHRF